MAYCTNCGAPITSQFCTKCGAQVGSADATAAPPPPPPSTSGPVIIPSSPLPAAAPAPKKRGPLFWILIGFLGLVVIGGILVVSGGLWFMNRVRQAGVDPALMQKSPGLAMAKILLSGNPDIEILAVDEDLGILKVREKKTGKTLTMDLKDVEKGKISFRDENNQLVEIQAQGEGANASVEVKGPEGSMRMGAGPGQLPDWVPSYPGSEGTGTFNVTSKEGKGGSYAFKTNDSVGDVVSFYEDELKSAGFEVEKNQLPASDRDSAVIFTAKDAGAQRTVTITMAGQGGTTTVSLLFESKK
jgi:hypothetical protein